MKDLDREQEIIENRGKVVMGEKLDVGHLVFIYMIDGPWRLLHGSA